MADVTPGQRNILDFFGRHARTKAEAHAIITQLMAEPGNERRWVIERARRCIAPMAAAVSGQKGHAATFGVACALVHGFALSIGEALPLMQEYNLRCQPPWSDAELHHKLHTAEKWDKHDKPRGHLLGDRVPSQPSQSTAPAPAPRPAARKVEFDPEKLREKSEPWNTVVRLPWLANRSAVDPASVTPERFLAMLYRPRENVLCFTNQRSQGQALWPKEKAPRGGPEGVWFLPQPVDGEMHINPRVGADRDGKPRWSRRSEESVTAFRYLLLESDEADPCDWLGLLVQLPLCIEAIYTSGGRSVHALVRVDCRTKREWDAYKESLTPAINLLCLGGLDPKVLTAVRLSRLPGCWRGDRLQKLLYVQPNAPVQRIHELPAVRDVEAMWCRHAELGISDEDDGTGARTVRAGLEFYAPTSARVRAALKTFDAAMADAGFDAGQLVR